MGDPYYDNLAYRGEGGIFVSLRCQRRWRDRFGRLRGREVWWLRFPGWRTEVGPFKSKFAALLHVAHRCCMSGARANLQPCVEAAQEAAMKVKP